MEVYRSIAHSIAADVDAGALRPGDRLPTHRALARRLGVAVPTVTRAYALARSWGLITGEVGRGTFVQRRSQEEVRLVGEPSYPDPGLINLAATYPPPLRGIESRAIAESMRKLSGRADLRMLMRAESITGPSRAHEIGVHWLARRGIEVSQERLIMSMGPQQALLAIFLACFKPGDVVLCESLTYPGVRALADALHLRLEPVQMDECGIIPEALDERCRALRARALYCVPTVHALTTAVMPSARRSRIAELARHHDILIIEDDEYSFVLPETPLPLAMHAPERSFLVIDTNKCLAPGLRIAQIIAPEAFVGALVQAMRTSIWTVPPLMLELTTEWFEGQRANDLVRQRAVEVNERRQIVDGNLAGLKGLDWRSPVGAQHYWLVIDPPRRVEALRDQAASEGVLVGNAAECAVGRTPAPNGLILALGGEADRGRFAEGVRRLASVLAS